MHCVHHQLAGGGWCARSDGGLWVVVCVEKSSRVVKIYHSESFAHSENLPLLHNKI